MSCSILGEDHKKTIQNGRELAKAIYENKYCREQIEKVSKHLLDRIIALIDGYSQYIWDLSQGKICVFPGTKLKIQAEKVIEQIIKCKTDKDLEKFKSQMRVNHLLPDHQQGSFYPGLVNRNDFDDVVKNGNMRERLTVANNFRYSCALVWDMIHLYLHDYKKWMKYFGGVIDEKVLKERMARMERKLGIPLKDVLNICYDYVFKTEASQDNKQEKKGLSDKSKCFIDTNVFTLCNYLLFPTSGLVLTSRLCPQGNCREKMSSPPNHYLTIEKQYMVPELSKREICYFKKSKDSYKDDGVTIKTPWSSGSSCILPKPGNFIYDYFDKKGKVLLTGPSGSTDLMLDITKLFTGFTAEDKVYLLLGLIVWMAVPADHSVIEILLVGAEQKVVNYNIQDDEYKYVRQLLKSIPSGANVIL